MRKTEQINDVSNLNLGEILSEHQPVIFKNISSDSLLLGNNSSAGEDLMNKLSDEIGSKVVSVMSGFYEDGGLLSYSNPNVDTRTRNTLIGPCAFDKFARQVLKMSRDERPGYLYSQLLDIGNSMPELLPMVRPLDAKLNVKGEAIWNLWLGSGKHRVNTHYDKVENFYFVLHGKKVFNIFEPKLLPELYSGPYEGGPSGIPESVVDSNNPDHKTFPRYSEALENSQVAEVCAGDMLYLPANWWHNVSSERLNVSANLWWSDIGKVERFRAELAFLQLLYSVKALPKHWRDYWMTNIDHYVFCKNGNPLEHLPKEKQGIAGEIEIEVLTGIKQKIRDLEQEIFRLELDIDLSDDRLKLNCSHLLNIKIESIDYIEISIGTHQVFTEEYNVLEILRAFSGGRRPLEVYEGKIAQLYKIDQFSEKLVKFIRHGVLVMSHE
ncbi:cupin-like domain-containing protein [Nitrosomonas aestuarii]|uniref:cupin-like domain-containing protein n=1 Tax=Nitrosomonas aestuarii TaxID=52441 RepID=UPI000D306840|nr:cupin-like domain-containing protein [Nitrosomonas aestuarii]PTN11815.1 Cupin-like domain-containing protein [Nitrosomonas aestuarii]